MSKQEDNKVVNIFDHRTKKSEESQEETLFEETIRKNEEKQKRIREERTKANKRVVRSYRLKK